MIVYLAGGLKDGWQDRVAPYLAGHTILDPRSWQDSDPAVYTVRDLEAVRAADCVLACMDSANPSGFGLSVELGYACALGKRVVFWDDLGKDWRSRYFDMHRQMASAVCRSEADIAREFAR